jgi:hypothetical protein
MFERFTERARQVVVLAQDEARALRHNYIGTEHLLLGLLREQEGLAARVLDVLDVTIEEVRAQVARIVGQGDDVTTGQIPFTPRAKKVLELSLREAVSLNHNYIGTEHILLGLVREGNGVATQILLDFDVDGEKIRKELIRTLSAPGQTDTEAEIVHESLEQGRRGYEPQMPPISADVIAELERLRAEKEMLIEQQDFEAAARARNRERRIIGAARALERAWTDELDELPVPHTVASHFPFSHVIDVRMPYVVSVVVCAVAFPIGLLCGWLIWT